MKNARWFIVPVLLLAVAFLVRSPYLAYAIYAFLLLVTLSYFSSLAWLAGLDCKRVVSRTTVREGDDTHVRVTVENRKGWPIPWIFIEDQFPTHMGIQGDNARLAVLMPGKSLTLFYTLSCPKRGYHRIGPCVMESGDLFGLQRRFRTGRTQDYVSVLPTIAYIDTFNVASRRPQGNVRIANRIYEDPTRFSGIREYVPGDPLNRIHWKATARTGELHTRTNEPSTVSGGTLILDLFELSYKPDRAEERMELGITITASIAYLLQMSGEQVGMITNAIDAAEVAEFEVAAKEVMSRYEIEDKIRERRESDLLSPLKVPTLKSTEQSQKITENLARVLPGHGLPVEQLILEEFRGLPRDAALLPVVPQVTESLALTLAEMKVAGFAVSVFVINDRVAFEEAEAILAPHLINTFHIRDTRDLHEISPMKIGHAMKV